MAEYKYVSPILTNTKYKKFFYFILKGKYKPYYGIISTYDTFKVYKDLLLENSEEQVNHMHELMEHWWFPAIIQMESGDVISNDLLRRLDEKLKILDDDPLKKCDLVDVYDAVYKHIFYYPENTVVPAVHPAYLLDNLTNEDKHKFQNLHQYISTMQYLGKLKADYPKHRMPYRTRA